MNIDSILLQLALGGDGIWYSPEVQTVSYPESGSETCFAVEDSSFWFRHRNNCIATIVQQFPPAGPIFDIGGGNGYVGKHLQDCGFDVALVEPSIAGARNAKSRGVKQVICATADPRHFAPESIPAAGLFDVVEHIEDDVAFLKSIRGLLREAGLVYLTVPAHSFLWSSEDDYAGHFRRYSVPQIAATLARAGFQPIFCSYIFRFLPVPIFLFRALPYKLGSRTYHENANSVSKDHGVNGGIGVRLANILLDKELKTLQAGKTIRQGASCLVVARKS